MKILFKTEKDNCLNLAETTDRTNANAETTAVETNNANILTSLMEGNLQPKIKMLILLLCISLFGYTNIFAQGVQPPGTGASNNPFVITTMDHWEWFAANGPVQSATLDNYFKLGADIGTDAIPVTQMVSGGIFYGKFDGGGHTITVRFSSSPIGLFARVRSLDTVVIKNFTVRGRINNEKYLKVYE